MLMKWATVLAVAFLLDRVLAAGDPRLVVVALLLLFAVVCFRVDASERTIVDE